MGPGSRYLGLGWSSRPPFRLPADASSITEPFDALSHYLATRGSRTFSNERGACMNRARDSGHVRRVGLADDHVPADGKVVYSFEQVLKVALGEERPTLSPGPDCTVEDALNDYWAYREAKSPALSVAIDKSKLTTHVGKALRARSVAALTTAELEKWRNALVGATEDRGLSPRGWGGCEPGGSE